MSTNILTVFTGGTICTAQKNGVISTDPSALPALFASYYASPSFCKDNVILSGGEFFNILSENMTVEKWNVLIKYFQSLFSESFPYDGIIIAHGTDTLAYTAALFKVLLSGLKLPVFFVSSNRPLLLENGCPDPLSNGSENFRYAVECISLGITHDVYATYKNPADGKMYLHKAKNLNQCRIYDENFFSADMLDITDIFNAPFKKGCSYQNNSHDVLLMNMQNKQLSNCVFCISPYVGLDYNCFQLSGFKAVLHSTYHSGTACTAPEDSLSLNWLILQCSKLHLPVYLAPAKSPKNATVYSSVTAIKENSVHFLYGATLEYIYAALVVAYSMGMDASSAQDFLSTLKIC